VCQDPSWSNAHRIDEFQFGKVLFIQVRGHPRREFNCRFPESLNVLTANSSPICFRCFDDECGLSSQSEQVFVASHKNVSHSALRQIKERLIFSVAALDRAFRNWMDAFAVGKVIALQL
jgi:hypothetical protein